MEELAQRLASSRAGRLGSCVVLLVVLATQIAAFHDSAIDDAFITFRYAQNLATGVGPVFNADQRVMGSTAPGQLLIASAVYRLVGRDGLPHVMAALGCLAWTAQAVAVFLLLRPELSLVFAALAGAFVLAGASGSMSWVLMETNLVAALVLWSFHFAKRARWLAAGATCALATVMRPDAFLAALVLGAWCLRDLRRQAWRPAALFVAIALPWPLFASAYFGSPLPQSAVAKFQRTGFFPYLWSAARSIAGELVLSSGWAGIGLALLLVGAGAFVLARRSRRLIPFLVYGLLHLTAYLYLRPIAEHVWHLYPAVLVSTVCLAAAVSWPAQAVSARGIRRLAALAGAAMVLLYAQKTVGGAIGHRSSYWGGNRHEVYLQVAEYLRERARPGDTLAAVEVGTIAYFSGIRVVDMGGLVTPSPGPTVKVDWLMLDTRYLFMAPRQQPVRIFRQGEFAAYLYHRDRFIRAIPGQ